MDNTVFTVIVITAAVCTALGVIVGFIVGIWATAKGLANRAKEKLSSEEVMTFYRLVSKIQ